MIDRDLTARRFEAPAGHRFEGRAWFACWLVALSVFFASAAGFNLANYRPVSDDDAMIMSVSHKIAGHGVMGSDLYPDFFDADRRYYIALPVHSILQAISFALAGTGVAQARYVSIASAIALIWVVSWLARSWYGPIAGVLAGLLLVFWRFELTAAHSGLPLLGLARAGRYDIVAVAWIWLALALLDRLLRRPGRATGLALGACCGVASLTQFFGVFVCPLVAIAWWWRRGRAALGDPISLWIAAGFLAVLLPYAAYIARDPAAFAAQYRATKGVRVGFDHPSFFLDNLMREPDRFRTLLDRPLPLVSAPYSFEHPFGPWLLIFGFVPALFTLWRRTRNHPAHWGNRLLALSLLVSGAMLALLDRTKAPVYAVSLAPSICVLFAAAAARAAERIRRHSWLLVPSLAVLAVVAVEGARAHRADLRSAAMASDYLAVGRRIDASLSPGAGLLGADRWWWALADHPYFSVNGLFMHWQWVAQHGNRTPDFGRMVDETPAEFLLVNDDVRGNLRGFPDRLQGEFREFLRGRTRLVGGLDDPTYGRIEIYDLRRVDGAVPR